VALDIDFVGLMQPLRLNGTFQVNPGWHPTGPPPRLSCHPVLSWFQVRIQRGNERVWIQGKREAITQYFDVGAGDDKSLPWPSKALQPTHTHPAALSASSGLLILVGRLHCAGEAASRAPGWVRRL
jgi:hypothetical protein